MRRKWRNYEENGEYRKKSKYIKRWWRTKKRVIVSARGSRWKRTEYAIKNEDSVKKWGRREEIVKRGMGWEEMNRILNISCRNKRKLKKMWREWKKLWEINVEFTIEQIYWRNEKEVKKLWGTVNKLEEEIQME